MEACEGGTAMGQPEDGADDGAAPQRGAGGKVPRGPRGGGKHGGKGAGKAPSGPAGLGAVRQCAFKVLCTDPLAANVIGSKGSTRAAMEEETGCSVWISKRDEVFPAPPFRILVLHGDDPEQVFRALESVLANLIEVAGRERDPDSPLRGKEPGEFVFHMALPTLITGKLIGKAGANITALKEKTGARIFVEPDIFDGHKSGRIIGYPDNILHALRDINALVQEEAGSEDYGDWALTQPLEAPSSKGKGGPREGGHHQTESWSRHRDAYEDHTPHDRNRHESRSPKRSRRSRGAQSGPQGPPFGGVPPGPPLQCLDALAREFREGELERTHAVSCTLPRSHVDALGGGGGGRVAHIERSTGTQISIEVGDIEGYSNMMITGPLLAVYAAHMAVMKTYHDKEHERAVQQQRRQQQQQQQQEHARVEDLQAQLATLESQLREVQRGSGGRPRSTAGKGKR